ncbi:phospholipid scramblase 2-like [Saccoglossus kowalevskii]|uniref:Phospholipid scramblase n=1 Tax=Saccoglossus kowalevskii TaxID=10224 RepID=A0ABM0GQ16_SACKO|nr:PREDICTED: phospholipid scramblase 1-like [Saccoglossus kowalevskii]
MTAGSDSVFTFDSLLRLHIPFPSTTVTFSVFRRRFRLTSVHFSRSLNFCLVRQTFTMSDQKYKVDDTQPVQQQPIPMQNVPGQQPQYPGYAGQPQVQYAGPGQPQQPYAQPPGQPPAPYGQPPMVQPGAPGVPGAPGAPIQWMQQPTGTVGCPRGLEYLTQIDQLLVHQQMEVFEILTNWETANRYQVKNSLGQQVYFAHEESETCMRQCCGNKRAFTMHITDNMSQEVIRVKREFKCCAGCSCCACVDCCSMEISVEAPIDTVVGYVKQSCSAWAPRYEILDANREPVFCIKGPCCMCQGICCTWDQEFVVHDKDGDSEVGKISKQWTGFLKEMYTQADNFSVQFPMDLDVKLKAVFLAAVFLIDFMYFEDPKKKKDHKD